MKKIIYCFCILFGSVLLISCGGGGSSSTSSSSTTLSGTAATGSALANATVNVYDSLGSLVGTTTTDSNGLYSLTVGSQFRAPFTIQVQGLSGDGATSLYSLAPSTGIANINQITNAIAASLSSNGDPSLHMTGTSATVSSITAADSSYSAALVNLTNALGVTGSFITGSFNAAYDKLLDNVTIDVKQNAGIAITTSAGMQSSSSDLLANAVVSTPYTSAFLASSGLPSASNASNLPALSSSSMLAASDLEYLRAKLQTCFAIPSASRGTPSLPATACAGLDSPSGDYLHAGYYWLDTTSGGGCTTGFYCLGLFGYMLSQATYDNLQFKTPQIIRPLDSSGATWLVKFPIQYSDESLGSLGDVISSSYMVVKKYTASGSDPGWRFYGDQRTVGSSIESNSQRIYNVFTGGVRYETGFNIYVNANRLRAIGGGALHVTKVTVTDLSGTNPVLPPAGITLYNKGTGSGFSWANSCGGFMSISQAVSPTNCNGVLRLAYTQSGSYGINSSSSSYLAFWPGTIGGATIDGNSGYLTDAQLGSIQPGQPFKFVVELSDGSTQINFVNRVHVSPRNTVDNQTLEYPVFTPATIVAMSSYLGGGSAFTINWQTMLNSRPYSAAIYWQNGGFSNNYGLTQTQINDKSVSIACIGSGANSCGNTANWGPSGKGLAQIRTRQGNGFQIFSQIRQY